MNNIDFTDPLATWDILVSEPESATQFEELMSQLVDKFGKVNEQFDK